MSKEQQDKLWNDLSEESKERVLYYYNSLVEHSEILGGHELKAVETQIGFLEDLFGSHNLKPKPLTYFDIEKEVCDINGKNYQKWSKKEIAIHRLLVVAKYLNGDWNPDWSDREQDKYFIGIDTTNNEELVIKRCWFTHYEIVYFRTEELAEQAIQILGEETIRLALSTDY